MSKKQKQTHEYICNRCRGTNDRTSTSYMSDYSGPTSTSCSNLQPINRIFHPRPRHAHYTQQWVSELPMVKIINPVESFDRFVHGREPIVCGRCLASRICIACAKIGDAVSFKCPDRHMLCTTCYYQSKQCIMCRPSTTIYDIGLLPSAVIGNILSFDSDNDTDIAIFTNSR